MTASDWLSGFSKLLAPLGGLNNNVGIAAGLGSSLLGVGATLLDGTDTRPHVERVRSAAPVVAHALAHAEALKAKLAAAAGPAPAPSKSSVHGA